MPPSAASNLPLWRARAPVKAPASWPKSSLSRMPSGRAPQLTTTIGLRRRGEAAWIARATTSLPVPDSPVTSTVESDWATFCTSSSTWRMAGEAPRKGGGATVLSRLCLRRRFSARSERCSAARLTSIERSSGSKGLTM